MLMNRRKMLLGSLATAALTLSGCKKATTTVVFVNSSNVVITVNATANGKKFKKVIPPGHKASQKYSTDGKGTTKPVTGTVTFKGIPTPPNPIPIPGGTTVYIGETNTYTVTATVAGGVFTAGPAFTYKID